MTVPCSNPADTLSYQVAFYKVMYVPSLITQALFLCCAGMGYKGLKASFYFALWKSAYGLVKDIAPVIKINGRHTADVVLRSCLRRGIHVNSGKFDLSCVP